MDEKTLERFMAKVIIEPNSYCWLWTGAALPLGYGKLYVGRVNGRKTTTPAHRLAYEHFVGPIPKGLFVCHKCDVPACVNPDHLWVGTHQENMRDMAAKDRWGRSPVTRGEVRRGPESTPRGEDAWNAKLTVEVVRAIRERRASGATYRELSAEYGLTESTLCRVCNRRSWAHVA